MFSQVISSTDDSRASETLKNDGAGSSKLRPDIEMPTLNSSNLAESELNLKSCDAMARGISSMLGTVIRDFDCRAESTVKSQDQLSFAINRLTGELDRLLEDAPLPFIMQHASKISGVRKRVSSLNSLLKSIQRRIDNIDQLISAGLSHDYQQKEEGEKAKKKGIFLRICFRLQLQGATIKNGEENYMTNKRAQSPKSEI